MTEPTENYLFLRIRAEDPATAAYAAGQMLVAPQAVADSLTSYGVTVDNALVRVVNPHGAPLDESRADHEQLAQLFASAHATEQRGVTGQ
jgi:hypothetical protein